jgi:nitroreductase
LPRDHHPEAERPECLLAVYPQTQTCQTRGLPKAVIQTLAQGEWHGAPNILSPDHRPWPIIDEVDEATRKPDTSEADDVAAEKILADPMIIDAPTVLLRHLIHRRRSAVAMDGVTTLSCAAFYSILQDCLPHAHHFPFNALPWPPKVDLLLFVHRVQDVTPGLYLLVRDPSRLTEQQQAFGREFEWIKPKDCPAGLSLYRLAGGDCRALAQRLGCHQDIAADGAFAVAMLAEFEPALKNYGAWFYRRLYWECGAIGQMLYLAAEARDIQATGIGCFFDDAVHEALGLQDRRYQSLYHFTLGGGVEDTRLTSLPPYPDEGQR